MDSQLELVFSNAIQRVEQYGEQVPTQNVIDLLRLLKSNIDGIFSPSERCQLERLQFKQWWAQEKERADQCDRLISALRNTISGLESRVTLDAMLEDERVVEFLDNTLTQEKREEFIKIIDQLEAPMC